MEWLRFSSVEAHQGEHFHPLKIAWKFVSFEKQGPFRAFSCPRCRVFSYTVTFTRQYRRAWCPNPDQCDMPWSLWVIEEISFLKSAPDKKKWANEQIRHQSSLCSWLRSGMKIKEHSHWQVEENAMTLLGHKQHCVTQKPPWSHFERGLIQFCVYPNEKLSEAYIFLSIWKGNASENSWLIWYRSKCVVGKKLCRIFACVGQCMLGMLGKIPPLCISKLYFVNTHIMRSNIIP